MQFKITITKEVIDKSLMCGVGQDNSSENCAFAVAYNQLIPVSVGTLYSSFYNKERFVIDQEWHTIEQSCFISAFDSMKIDPVRRYTLVGQTFDVEIPDEVIEYWYGDASIAAQKIIDNPILQIA